MLRNMTVASIINRALDVFRSLKTTNNEGTVLYVRVKVSGLRFGKNMYGGNDSLSLKLQTKMMSSAYSNRSYM